MWPFKKRYVTVASVRQPQPSFSSLKEKPWAKHALKKWQEFCAENDVKMVDDALAIERLFLHWHEALERNEPKVTIYIPFISMDQKHNPRHFNERLTREELLGEAPP